MTEVIPGGRPGIAAQGKPRRHRRPHRGKAHAPFLHAHPLARPGLRGHAQVRARSPEPEPAPAPDQNGPDPK